MRYFFIADRVKLGEIRIAYCPTGLMIANYFTKPLQGVLFKRLRGMIMGHVEIALPPDELETVADTPIGIPPVDSQPESRSVLEYNACNDSVASKGSKTRLCALVY